jgi:hypothetical protein
MASLNTVLQSRKTVDELRILSAIFFEDMEHVSVDDFRECVKRYRRKSRYFPSPVDLLTIYDSIKAENRANMKLLDMPPELTDEQVRLNIEKIKALKECLRTKGLKGVSEINFDTID